MVQFDLDEDGVISLDEFEIALQKLGVHPGNM